MCASFVKEVKRECADVKAGAAGEKMLKQSATLFLSFLSPFNNAK